MHVEPPSTTSKISNPLNFLLLQTRPNCLGRSWNLSTKRLERRLHSGPPYLLDIIIWRLSRRETNSHLCFHSEACLYPQPSLRMPDWGLLQKKMARKNTYNAINLPDLRSFKTPSNLVPRVLWLFGQRMGASRDSGIMEFLIPENVGIRSLCACLTLKRK